MGWVIAFSAVLMIVIVLLIRSEHEKKQLTVTPYEFVSGKVPDSFDGKRFVFLSDLHTTSFGENNERLIREVNELKPDVLLLGGDMIRRKRHGAPDFKSLETFLSGVQAEMILYGMGNHESRMLSDEGKHPDAVRRFRTLTEALDVRILDERAVTLRDGSGSVRVSGVTLPDEYYEKGRKKTPEVPLFSNGMISPGILNVAMVHSPLYMEEAVKEGADLVLSGHFHGGTIYLGKLGGLMTPQLGFFEKRVRGMFHYGTGAGIVSAGLGTHSIKLRLNNKPEIVCITLRKGS